MSDELEKTLLERGGRYGEFLENANISQKLKDILRSSQGWDDLYNDHREALEMIAAKISRILCGDPSYEDNWVDIAGYASLVLRRIREQKV